jgi:hypothetical protein
MDIFSIPVIISIIVFIVCLGAIYYWVNIKLTDQDHKLESMLSLVSTLVGEVNQLKMRPVGGTIRQVQPQFTPVLNDLIEVSSNEDSDSEDEDSDDGDLNTESEILSIESVSDKDSVSDEDSEIDDSKEDEDLEKELEEDNKSVENIKTIHIDLEDGNLVHDILVSEIQLEEPLDIDLGISENIDLVHNEDVVEDTTLEEVPHVEVEVSTNSNLGEKENDYKKMSINGLREIVVKKGLVDMETASKLKKNEILKMLH